LASVRFVGDDNDVAPLGKHWVLIAPFFRQKFLDSREDHTTRVDVELRAHVGAAFSLYRRLAQEFFAAREGAEKLIVEIVSVGENDERRICHLRFKDHSTGIERHRETFP